MVSTSEVQKAIPDSKPPFLTNPKRWYHGWYSKVQKRYLFLACGEVIKGSCLGLKPVSNCRNSCRSSAKWFTNIVLHLGTFS